MADNNIGISNADLTELNEIFKEMGGVEKVADFTNNFENLPDGLYNGEILEVTPKTAQKTGRPMLDILVGLEGARKEHVFLMCAGKDKNSTQTAIARTITQLKKLGIEGADFNDFVTNAESLVGTSVNLDIKTNNGFTNKYLTLR